MVYNVYRFYPDTQSLITEKQFFLPDLTKSVRVACENKRVWERVIRSSKEEAQHALERSIELAVTYLSTSTKH